MPSREFFLQFHSQTMSHMFELLSRSRFACHALKLILENHPQIAVTREKDFVVWSIMSRQVAGEAIYRRRGKPCLGKHLPHVKEVTWVLAVPGRHNLATINFRRRKYRRRNLCC